MCFGIWLNAADALVTATLMPSVARDLGGFAYFAWATAGFLLGAIVAGGTAGRLSEHLGLRLALAGSALVYSIGCVLSAAAPDILVFLAGRVIQGFGGGWITGLCFVAIAALFPDALQPRLFAAISAVWGAVTLLGPLVGGLFASDGLWRWAFWGFGAQAVAFILVTLALLPSVREKAETGSPPFRQLALLVAGVVCTALADVSAQPLAALALVSVGLGLLLLTLLVKATGTSRLFPDETAQLHTAAGAGYAMVFLLSAGAIAFSVYGAALLQARYGLTPLAAGYVIGAESIGWSGVAILASRAPPAWHGAMIRAGAVTVGLGMAALAASFGRAPLAVVVASAVLLGAGFGVCFAFVNARIVAGVPERERTIAAAAVPTVQMTGNAVGAAAAGALANLLGLARGVTATAAEHVAPWLFGVFVPVCALGALAAVRVGYKQVKI